MVERVQQLLGSYRGKVTAFALRTDALHQRSLDASLRVRVRAHFDCIGHGVDGADFVQEARPFIGRVVIVSIEHRRVATGSTEFAPRSSGVGIWVLEGTMD